MGSGHNAYPTTSSLTQPFGFSTKRYDPQTGLIYYGHRYYSPAIGRWTTRDPVGEAGGLNLYAFVGNNPVNWVDPWGLAHYVLIHTPKTSLGRDPERAANTRAKELHDEGHTTTIIGVTTVTGFTTAITGGSFIDGGIIFWGHSSVTGGIYLGKDSNGVRQAIDGSNINQLSNSNLGPNAFIELNSCESAIPKGSIPSAAQMFADQLQRDVWGSTRTMSFRGPDKKWIKPPGKPPKGNVDIYLMPDLGGKMIKISPQK